MVVDFVIPVSRDDLLRHTGPNQYYVDDVLPQQLLPQKLQECKLMVRSYGPFGVVEQFDTFFSILKHADHLNPDVKEDGWELLLKGLNGLTAQLGDLLEGELDSTTRMKFMTAVKMMCYLLCQFTDMFEADTSAMQTITGKGRKSSKKMTVGSMDWDEEKDRGVHVLVQLIGLNIHRLWDPPVLEEEFVNLVTGCCYKLLENPSTSRNKATRDRLFHLIGIMIKRYNHGFSCSVKILQLLQHFEHLVSPLATAVQMFVQEHGAKSIVSEVLREISRMDPAVLVRDSSGTRSYAAFLVELAEKVPQEVLKNISLLLHFLDDEPYTMRNAVVGVLKEIVIQVLNKDDLDPKYKDTRNQFLDRLEDHIHDMNAFVRSRTIQVWISIVNSGAMPLSRIHHVLELVVGRLMDKSSQVRKNAVQFTTASLKTNPYAAKRILNMGTRPLRALTMDELKESCRAEEAKLEEMMPQQNSGESQGGETSKEQEVWSAMEPALRQAVVSLLKEPPEDGVDFTDEDTVESVTEQIRDKLKEAVYTEAIVILQAAHDCWPDAPVFCYSTETGENNAGDEEESSEAASVSEEDPKVEGFMFCLRNLMIGPADLAALTESLSTSGQEGALATQVVNEVTKQQVLVKYLQDSLAFAQHIQTSIPIICQLLGSKTSSDVMEAIDFFVTGYEFGINNAIVGIRRMLARVWSSETSIKEAVVGAYKRLYLQQQGGDARSRAVATVASLSMLMTGASLGDITSLEELVSEFVRSGELGQREITVMWERFTMKIPGTSESDSRAALMLLNMAAGADPGIIRSNINVLVKEGLGERANADFVLPRLACKALLKLALASKPKAGNTQEPYRLSQDHELFTRLKEILISGLDKVDNDQWIPLTAQAINVIYSLAEHSDAICGELIKGLAAEIVKPSQANVSQEIGSGDNGTSATAVASGVLTRFLFVVGHVAFRQLMHIDTNIFGEMKRRHRLQEEGQTKKKQKPSSTKTPSRNKSTNDTTANATNELTAEEEMGLAGAAAEDAEAEYIRHICETDIVTGPNLLGVLRPLILAVMNNPTKFSDPDLQAAATMALAKYMLVSSVFCESHLQLLFTVLEKSPNPVIRANTIIALGDLTVRFPNLIEPWTPHLYKRLRDPSSHVRKNTVQVLTHLILNDMLKVKGHISEMAQCIVDGNERISGLAKLFFHELAKKGNAVYNIMPDIISRLSDPEIGVEEDDFQSILKYLFSFIQKDRQCESLVEKLCHRFRATRVERQWRDLAFCLALLSYSEKSLRKLQENFACFADKLGDELIYQSFTTILTGAKKFAKLQTKTLIEELEQRIEQCHNKGAEEIETAVAASKASAAARKKGGRTPRKTPAKTPGRGRKPRASQAVNMEDSPAVRRRRKAALSFSSDESDDDDVFQAKDTASKNGLAESDSENHDPNIETPTDDDSPVAIMKRRHKSVSNKASNAKASHAVGRRKASARVK